MKRLGSALIGVALVFPASVPSLAHQGTQQWEFDAVDRIEIEGVAGDLVVRAGSGAGVILELDQDVRPSDAFRAEVDASGGTLRVREDWGRGRSRGGVEWTLTVPASAPLTIVFETASGDLEATAVSARFDFDTASGDVRLTDATIAEGSSFDTASGDLMLRNVVIGTSVDMDTASGDIELDGVTAADDFVVSTASGNVRIEGSAGIRRASTASGRVRVIGGRLSGPSEFSSASGDVTVSLTEIPAHALELSSASGDVELDSPFGSDFSLVMSKRRDRGSINSPFDPTSEEEYERNGQPYVRRTVVRGAGGPEIRLHTASGSIRVTDR